MGGLAYLGGFSQTQLSYVKALMNAAKTQVAETQGKNGMWQNPKVALTKTPLGYRFWAREPSKKMRLDESFRYLCLTPQNTLLVTMLKHFLF